MSGRLGRFVAFGLAVTVAASMPAGAQGITERVSLGPGGAQANDESDVPSISADGRFIAFQSDATNLVPGDTNGTDDVFVRDRQQGTTRRVSLGPRGVQGDYNSYGQAISAHGRFVAFGSSASNLVPGDTNGTTDVFIRDRQAHTTRRVSVGPGGVQADSSSQSPEISAHGRFVAFASEATNLVPGDTNLSFDVFVRDRQKGTTRRVSLGSGGVQGDGISYEPAISAHGRFVAFSSNATNLVPGDTNNRSDVFVRDRQAHTTRRVSLGPRGVQADGYRYGSFSPALSADGRFVVFSSDATNLVPGDTNLSFDAFVRDRRTRKTERVSIGRNGAQGNSASYGTAISADGRFVGFSSDATNLVPGDTNGSGDVFVRDRQAGTTRRVSVGRRGVQADQDSFGPVLSRDGRFAAFSSDATNLVPGDTNGTTDVFVRRRW